MYKKYVNFTLFHYYLSYRFIQEQNNYKTKLRFDVTYDLEYSTKKL